LTSTGLPLPAAGAASVPVDDDVDGDLDGDEAGFGAADVDGGAAGVADAPGFGGSSASFTSRRILA
jgi:hypothetical protein